MENIIHMVTGKQTLEWEETKQQTGWRMKQLGKAIKGLRSIGFQNVKCLAN